MAGMLAIVEAAHALGDAGLARQAYDLLVPYADLPIMPSLAVTCFGSVQRVLGVAALTFNDTELAVAHLHRSVTANRLLPNRPVTAVATADLAGALLRRGRPGDREDARTLLAEACAEAGALGLTVRAQAWSRRLAEITSQAATIGHEHRHWTLEVDGRQIVVADRLGVQYLARLLTNPGRQLSALELVSVPTTDSTSQALAPVTRQPLLDQDARAAYRRRVHQLTSELASADARGDQQGSQRLQAELDALLDELRRATGKGGRARAFSDAGERARTAVRKAIKRAIDEIRASDPDLAALLDTTVTTGNICSYTPDPQRPLHWTYVADAPQP